MRRTELSYFRPDGSYRGTMIVFVPEQEAGETLHEDGISIVRADGTLFRQENPYVTKARYTRENLTEVEGELSGAWRLRSGKPERIPDEERPPPAKTEIEHRIDALTAKVTALEAASPKLTEEPIKR